MKNKRAKLTTFTVIFTVIVALAVFLLIWYWGDTYPDFEDFEESVRIPGLDEGAVPQGLANYNSSYTITNDDGESVTGKQNYYFISAYMKEGPSRIYVTGDVTGYVGYVTMISDGEDFYGHCGGIATDGTTLWIASDGMVYVAKRSNSSYTNIATEIIAKAKLNATSSDDEESDTVNSIEFTESFKANCGADFCFYYGGSSTKRLYVGEFYRKGNYETDEKHHVTTPAGDGNTAFVYEYSVTTGSNYEYGLMTLTSSDGAKSEATEKVPKIQNIYSIPEQIQGLARTESGALVLSQSYGASPSHLYYYDWSAVSATSNRKNYTDLVGKNFYYEGIKTASGADFYVNNLYVYFVDSSSLVKDYTLPSMSEGLCVTDDVNVNVLFESGCYKYRAVVRQVENSIYYFTPKKES